MLWADKQFTPSETNDKQKRLVKTVIKHTIINQKQRFIPSAIEVDCIVSYYLY